MIKYLIKNLTKLTLGGPNLDVILSSQRSFINSEGNARRNVLSSVLVSL